MRIWCYIRVTPLKLIINFILNTCLTEIVRRIYMLIIPGSQKVKAFVSFCLFVFSEIPRESVCGGLGLTKASSFFLFD